MTQSAVPELAERKWFGLRRAHATHRTRAVPPFAELTYLHHRWRKALDTNASDQEQREKSYHRCRAAFEAEHGAIVNEYWCWHVASAVALTEKPRPAPASWFLRPKIAFHRASDWATKDESEVARQLHRCDELAIHAMQVLSGLRRRICLHLVMNSASHLLSFVDARAAHESADAVVEHEKEALDKTQAYYRGAANGQAQIVYFAGMAAVAAALGAFALIGIWWIQLPFAVDREFYGSIAAGAFGALVSVIARINSGHFDLTYDYGRPYLAFLGALRPVLGAGFGLILYFAVESGLLTIFAIPEQGELERFFAFLVIAFLAGFSERWAQDTITSLAPSAPKGETPPRPVPGER